MLIRLSLRRRFALSLRPRFLIHTVAALDLVLCLNYRVSSETMIAQNDAFHQAIKKVSKDARALQKAEAFRLKGAGDSLSNPPAPSARIVVCT
jgi:hypothetical protein